MNATGPYWYVNIGSGNGLMSSGNKPLPQPMLTQIVNIMMSLGHNELICSPRPWGHKPLQAVGFWHTITRTRWLVSTHISQPNNNVCKYSICRLGCKACRYLGHGEEITSTAYCGKWLLIHVLYRELLHTRSCMILYERHKNHCSAK